LQTQGKIFARPCRTKEASASTGKREPIKKIREKRKLETAFITPSSKQNSEMPFQKERMHRTDQVMALK
jgi:hypothetical protein